MKPEHDSHKTFHVQVGHARVTVRCETREQALQMARRQLGNELPRLYDIIHQLDPARFRIEPQF
jgi:hypothetical protein